MDFYPFCLSGISPRISPHSGIISFFLIRGLITCDLSGADPTPAYATRVSPGPTNERTSPLSSLIGWEMQLIKAKPTRAPPRSLLLVLSTGVTELASVGFIWVWRLEAILLTTETDRKESPAPKIFTKFIQDRFLQSLFEIGMTYVLSYKLKILKHVQNEFFPSLLLFHFYQLLCFQTRNLAFNSCLASFLHTTHFSPVVPFLNISRVLLCLPVHVLVQALILHLSNSYNGLPFPIFVFWSHLIKSGR